MRSRQAVTTSRAERAPERTCSAISAAVGSRTARPPRSTGSVARADGGRSAPPAGVSSRPDAALSSGCAAPARWARFAGATGGIRTWPSRRSGALASTTSRARPSAGSSVASCTGCRTDVAGSSRSGRPGGPRVSPGARAPSGGLRAPSGGLRAPSGGLRAPPGRLRAPANRISSSRRAAVSRSPSEPIGSIRTQARDAIFLRSSTVTCINLRQEFSFLKAFLQFRALRRPATLRAAPQTSATGC